MPDTPEFLSVDGGTCMCPQAGSVYDQLAAELDYHLGPGGCFTQISHLDQSTFLGQPGPVGERRHFSWESPL